MGLFKDEGVESKSLELAYSLLLQFLTCIESERTLSASGNICTKIGLQLIDTIDLMFSKLVLLKRTINYIIFYVS